MQIVHYPDPVLRQIADPVTEITEEIRRAVGEMFELMYEAPGVGLAAPQVGWCVRLFVVNPAAHPDEGEEYVFINPKITGKKGATFADEGCLSIPGVMGSVRRAKSIQMEATDLEGKRFRIDAQDLLARIIQHEQDHLDGILFTDKVSDVDRPGIERQLESIQSPPQPQ